MIGTKIYRLFEKMSYNPLSERKTFTDENGKVWIEQLPKTPWVNTVVEYDVISVVEVKISGVNLEEILELVPWETEECFSTRYILKSEDEDVEVVILKDNEMKAVLGGNFEEFYLERNDAEKESEKINANRV